MLDALQAPAQAITQFPEWVEWIAKLAPGIGALITAATVLVAYRKYKSDRAAQDYASAMQIYRQYLGLAFEHPRLAEPAIYRIDPNSEEFSQYEWFVSILLRACEEVIESLGKKYDSEWQTTLRHQLEYHAEYLRTNPWFRAEGMKHFSRKLRDLIDEVTRSKAAE